MISTTYPLLDIFWTMLEIFMFFVWIWLLIGDLQRHLPQP